MRLEQRYLPEEAGTSWRLRIRAAGAFELAKGWKWTIGDEVFVTINETTSAVAQGLGQNRFELGVTRQLGERTTLHPRYIAQYRKRTASGAKDVQDHVLSVSIEITLQ